MHGGSVSHRTILPPSIVQPFFLSTSTFLFLQGSYRWIACHEQGLPIRLWSTKLSKYINLKRKHNQSFSSKLMPIIMFLLCIICKVPQVADNYELICISTGVEQHIANILWLRMTCSRFHNWWVCIKISCIYPFSQVTYIKLIQYHFPTIQNSFPPTYLTLWGDFDSWTQSSAELDPTRFIFIYLRLKNVWHYFFFCENKTQHIPFPHN